MARLVKMDGLKPAPVEVAGETKWVCMCGLSNNKPLCDGSHKKCSGEEEGKVYQYDAEGNRTEVQG
jgi:CDGSH-type Zn-finger protein